MKTKKNSINTPFKLPTQLKISKIKPELTCSWLPWTLQRTDRLNSVVYHRERTHCWGICHEPVIPFAVFKCSKPYTKALCAVVESRGGWVLWDGERVIGDC